MLSDPMFVPSSQGAGYTPGGDNARLEDLFQRQPIESLSSARSLFCQGDKAGHVFEVVEGALRICRVMSDGRRVITGFAFAGDLIGVSLRDRYLYSAEAINRVKIRRFSRSRFQAVIDATPELRTQLFARLCDEMASAQEQVMLLARKSAEERVCSFLLHIVRRRCSSLGSPAPVIELPMTRLDMADYLGLTIETVSRIMAKLAAQSVLLADGRHSVAIKNLRKLASLAGDDRDVDADIQASGRNDRAEWRQ